MFLSLAFFPQHAWRSYQVVECSNSFLKNYLFNSSVVFHWVYATIYSFYYYWTLSCFQHWVIMNKAAMNSLLLDMSLGVE